MSLRVTIKEIGCRYRGGCGGDSCYRCNEAIKALNRRIKYLIVERDKIENIVKMKG